MEAGLLDFIFQGLEVQHLKRKEVMEHLDYLNEIITPKMAAPDQVKFLSVKVQLNDRLVQLDKLSMSSSSWCNPVSKTSFPAAAGPAQADRPVAMPTRCA